ncbi:MAG TPA: hypothetical protein VMR25_14425 [Planctomycetaceae bacterium]|jgi:hypothetical protein|nr:hypothetical protein [Planctomycetaceae bacterium]
MSNGTSGDGHSGSLPDSLPDSLPGPDDQTRAGNASGENGGALSRLGGWQVFVLALLMLGGGGYMVHVGTLPVWALLLTVGAYLLGVGAVVKLLAALADLRCHVSATVSNAVAQHHVITDAAVQSVKSDARQTVQSHTAAVEQACGNVLTELKENTGLTQNAVDRLAELQKGRKAK